MTTPPSIRDYRSEAEWQTAMNEWCAENEPAYKLYDDDGRPVFKSLLDLFPKVQYCPRYPKRYLPPYCKPHGGCPDKLDGGSRADYRMAGYRRY